MVTIITHLDASASLDYDPPVSGLAYLNFFRREADLRRNLVGPAPAVVGAPGFGPGYVITTGGAHYLNTGVIDDTVELTLVTLCKAAALSGAVASSQVFVGNYRGDTAAGMGANLYVAGNANARMTGSYWEGASRKRELISARPSDAWAVRALRLNATRAVVEDSAGARQEYEITVPRSLANTNQLGIGWGGASFSGVSHIASVAIARRFLSDSELADLSRILRSVGQADGLMV